ncbi:MAG: DUF4389 domain-containing protein [Acidimicrobiales bacterium]
MRPVRIFLLVIGCLLVLPGIALLAGGSTLALGYVLGRDDDGFVEVSLDRLESSTVAITAEDLDLTAGPGSPDRVWDGLDVDVRLQATSSNGEDPLFIGIASETEVDAYLAGFAHDEIEDVDDDLTAQYRTRAGALDIGPPTEEGFWTASASGSGTQQLLWEATEGRWAVVLMNADGSPGLAVDTDVGVKAGFIGPLVAILLGIGLLLTVGAVALIVAGANRPETRHVASPSSVPGAGPAGEAVPIASQSPVALKAVLDPQLSPWKWLVKWLLAIPHAIVLVFLWIGFTVLTVVAGFAILFTGRYPRGLFDFNVGVLRWTWRVSYYATTGGIGTDRYPPFSLDHDPDYPADLTIDYPEQLSRGLVLVKWWLLAIPHYIIVGLLVGGSFVWTSTGDNTNAGDGIGLLAILVLIAGVILAFTGRYQRPLFDLIVGLNRWIYRVIAYAALMTDQYPPFRLDQGGAEPAPLLPDDQPPGSAPAEVDADTDTDVDLREPVPAKTGS